ncbi:MULTISPECIES: hypothetical protein [unclassified Ensifer]|uniref:hypothetical protein n=1 Tax=unclassified Ensifer TaxID=2633371 RepID=UPI0008138053|nr:MULTISPECIES: hypothetical protein [unclassified Ensifer]OCP21938.1 hypothetical protein BC361_25555 [Ensifer sp. LC54]OCP23282.1 hypothetical protein BC363_25210 [Ensifer sp. LC384]
MTHVIRVPSVYDRPGHACWVVKHPDPTYCAEWFAIYNHETDQFKLDRDGKIKRYWQGGLSLAGYDMDNDSVWLKELPDRADHLKYGPFDAEARNKEIDAELRAQGIKIPGEEN